MTNADYSRGSFGGTVCLTRAAGRHPLDNGVRTLTFVGVKRPRAESGWGGVTVEADGVRIALKGATLERDTETILITIGVPPEAPRARAIGWLREHFSNPVRGPR